MSQVVDPFKIIKDRSIVNEKPQTLAKRQLLDTLRSVETFLNYEQKFEEKFSMSEAFAVVWQTSGKDLRGKVDSLIPLMEGHSILKQKLSTVLELIDENLHLLEKIGIAVKTIGFYTERSEAVSRQTQAVLGEMIESLTFGVGLESLATVQKEMQVMALAEQAANAQTESRSAQAIVFSGQAQLTMTALNALKEELIRVQTALGIGAKTNASSSSQRNRHSQKTT